MKMTIDRLSIDTSTICQLKCPECSTAKGIIKNGIIGSGFLKLEDFKQLIEQNPAVKKIELSNWGEIFLNPRISEIMEYACRKGIRLSAGNGTNFNNLSLSVLEDLVRYQFDYINISIDGASQDTYSKYRLKGSFDKVMENIKILNSFKEKHNSQFPKLAWQFIIFGHNEHEIPKAKALCRELKMVFNPRLNHSSFSPVIDTEFVSRESGLGVATRQEYKAKYHKNYKRPCCQLWFSPQINWDGKLLGCCVNKWVSFGNVFSDGLENSLNSRLYTKTLAALSGKGPVDESMPCYYCPTYKQVSETPVTQRELQEFADFKHPAEMQ